MTVRRIASLAAGALIVFGATSVAANAADSSSPASPGTVATTPAPAQPEPTPAQGQAEPTPTPTPSVEDVTWGG
ncbi:hypothetical protein ACFFSH_24310 [Streptomyces filamentosus]|uniref:Uncharacterized protein n=1 Tax=Streptomyces filamentosus TaxID=67294 RepID=A0A919BQQ8_STRFL|nr:hypothetical protein [Streptomyces filamentosus]KAA6215665.1 hypothetical protein CP979_00725 [Streptomyces filamentosus]GHG06200.1 hypothetical protein GCM10017667_41620 [Streptomyces filamentosus]